MNNNNCEIGSRGVASIKSHITPKRFLRCLSIERSWLFAFWVWANLHYRGNALGIAYVIIGVSVSSWSVLRGDIDVSIYGLYRRLKEWSQAPVGANHNYGRNENLIELICGCLWGSDAYLSWCLTDHVPVRGVGWGEMRGVCSRLVPNKRCVVEFFNRIMLVEKLLILYSNPSEFGCVCLSAKCWQTR